MYNFLNRYFFQRLIDSRKLENCKFVIVDIETTGLDPKNSKIIEIAAIKIKKNICLDKFEMLIDPKSFIPINITNITGITDQMLIRKPPVENALQNFLKFISGTPLVAHNSEFDINFLKYHLNLYLNKNLDNQTFCTLKLSKLLFPNLKNYKLHTIATHLEIPILNRHRAMGDCLITHLIWIKMIEMLKQKAIVTIKDLKRII